MVHAHADQYQPSRLLIVDDDPQSLRLLGSILVDIARISFAASSDEALRQIGKLKPDLVLLDSEMPGPGGNDFCTALRSDPENADLPVVFITPHADTGSETRAFALGAADCIHKPINPPVALARIRTQLALKRKTDELMRLTTLDALTGIPNRRAFNDILGREWRRAMRSHEPLSLLLLDIDYFKRYNDLYSNRAGDACLRQVAAALAQSAQRAGDVVARYSGERFAVILPQTRPGDAQAFAERLCARVRNLAIPHGDSPVAPQVTISVGVASLCTPCADNDEPPPPCHRCPRFERCRAAPEGLIALAGQALGAAEGNGRAQVSCLVATSDSAVTERPGA